MGLDPLDAHPFCKVHIFPPRFLFVGDERSPHSGYSTPLKVCAANPFRRNQASALRADSVEGRLLSADVSHNCSSFSANF